MRNGLSSRHVWLGLLIATVAGTTAWLASHAPFAFYSPDVSFQTAKVRGAAEGELFRDPFSGTPSIYPSLFHATFAVPQRLFGWTGFESARAVGVVNWIALFAAAFLLALVLLRDAAGAAAATLAVPLVFYEPTGRHILSEIPANFSVPILVAGIALVLDGLESARGPRLAAGLVLAGLAVNVVWYQAVGAAALLVVALIVAWRTRPHPPLGRALPFFVLPFAFTAWHFWSIRDVLPDYAGYAQSQVGALGGALQDWLATLLTRANFRYHALLARSAFERAYWYGLALPAGLILLGGSVVLGWRLRADAAPAAARLRRAGATALCVFVFSLGLAATRDVPRLAVVQFVGYLLLVPFALGGLAHLAPRLAARLRLPFALAGVIGAAHAVWHTDRPFERDPPPETAAVVRWIAALPGHRDTRLFVSSGEVRRLAPFVTFLSLSAHTGGRYYSQDPVSSARLLEDHAQIYGGGEQWREALAANGIRYLAFRHGGGGRELEAGTFYLKQGARAALANREWWVLEIDPRRSRP